MERKSSYFSEIDDCLGDFVSSLTCQSNENIRLAAKLVSRQLRNGHVCLDLREYAGKTLECAEENEKFLQLPELSEWVKFLTEDEHVGGPGEFKPLILDDHHRLYFHRYWRYERDVIDFIQQRSYSENRKATSDIKKIQHKLHFYFPETLNSEIDWPGVAALAALIKKFLVITGSPGTGKTTTVAKILAFISDVEKKSHRIALCAPTGKAAQRLEESIKKAKMSSNWSDDIKNVIPDEAKTLHRLLGSLRFSPYFRYNKNNLLPYDIVVIDEASMVDLPMMAKLMQALHSDARLILLGDKDQLASVEAGAVLGSICFTSPLNHFSDSFLNVISMIFTKTMNPTGRAEGVWDSIIELRKNYRFSETSDLRIVSQAVKNGNGEQVLLFLRNGKFKDVRFYDLHRTEENISEMLHYFMESYREYLDAVALNQKSPEEIFMLFENFRILCALRSGYWGIERVNRLIEKFFIDQNLLFMGDLHYAGQPLMILQNDYVMNLFNGDVGIVLEDKEDGNRLKAYFQHDKEGMRKVSLERLPRHETAWAMTVHKSQGSEYNEISLILSDFENPVLTKELVYTGLTRARESVSIWSSPKIFLKAINNRIVRHSGLADALKQ